MNDLTQGFRTFRELARVVWNSGLRLYPDGEHEFVFAEEALFAAMVASQTSQVLARRKDVNGIDYYAQIRVIPTQQQRATALVGYEEPKGINWRAEEIATSADLKLGYVFDFDSLDGSYRDFRYVFCADVTDPENPRRVLIDAHDVTLEEVTDEQSDASLA